MWTLVVNSGHWNCLDFAPHGQLLVSFPSFRWEKQTNRNNNKVLTYLKVWILELDGNSNEHSKMQIHWFEHAGKWREAWFLIRTKAGQQRYAAVKMMETAQEDIFIRMYQKHSFSQTITNCHSLVL